MEILPQLVLNSLIAGSLYALASSGLSLTFGLLRILNFAHGHLMMLGAYLFFFASVVLGLGILSSSLLVLAAMAAFGVLTLAVFILPFKRFDPFLAFVSTLALSSMIEAIVSMVFGVDVKSIDTGATESRLLLGAYVTPLQIVIIASALMLMIGLAFVIHSTALGRKIRAIAETPHAAEAVGIARLRIVIGVFTLSVLLAAYAGVLAGMETNLGVGMGNSYTIKSLAAMVLGGLGNVWGTIVGSYLLGFVENFAIGIEIGGVSMPAGYKDAFSFVLILAILLVKPEGLLRRSRRKV